jgi:hypothetical protein
VRQAERQARRRAARQPQQQPVAAVTEDSVSVARGQATATAYARTAEQFANLEIKR